MPGSLSPARSLWLWLLLASCLLLLAWLRWPQSAWLVTDIQGLLPEAADSEWERIATEKASSRYAGQVLLMVRGGEQRQGTAFLELAVSRLVNAGYTDSGFEQSQAARWSALASALAPHRLGLVAAEDRVRLERAPGAYLEDFQRLLYSPLGGPWVNALPTDPLGLYRNFLMAAAPAAPAANNKDDFVAAVVQVKPQMLGLNQLPGLYELYVELGQEARDQGLVFSAAGAPLYTAFGAASGRQEMSTIGVISLLALSMLLIWFLRSARALVLSLICVVAGVAGGLVITVSALQQVHLLTLVFGATLVGIAADYAFHYLAHSLLPGWRSETGLSVVLPGLALACLSSVVAFSVLALLPFPGIRQIGTFMASGLLCSFATVCLLFPVFYRLPSRITELPLRRSRTTRPLLSPVYLLLITVVVMPGLLLLQPRDEVRDFYAVPSQLAKDEAVILQVHGRSAVDSRFLLLQAPDENSLLRLEEQLIAASDAALQGISSLVPSAETQQANVALQRELFTRGAMDTYFRQIGLREDARQAYGEALMAEFKPLRLAALAGLRLPFGAGGFLGCDTDSCASWLGLNSQAAEPGRLAALAPGISVVDPVASINRMLAGYRGGVAVMLVSAVLAVSLVLGFVIGWRKTLQIVLVPALSCSLSLAFIGYIHGGYSVINLLALLLVIGVGLDFAIFRGLTCGASQVATTLAISLSAATSILAFGMLAFSQTPVISDFGQTIALGLVFAWLLSWFHPVSDEKT